MRPDHPIPEAFAQFVVLHMPVPRVKPHAGMKEEQNKNGNKAQPIQVVSARTCKAFCVHKISFDKERCAEHQVKTVFIV